MTREVLVTISGFLTDDDGKNTIEIVHIGEYYERNGSRYILFEELIEGVRVPIKNVIKVKENYLEIQKKGPITVNMVFEEGKSQSGTYSVPYGSFLVETHTTSVRIDEDEDRLEVRAAYKLEINGAQYADCDVKVKVESRETFQL